MAPAATFEGINGHPEPTYGSRLLPQVVDELARSDPSRVYAIFPRSSDLFQGFCHVTMLELAQAVSQHAFWLEEKFGRSTNFETVSYMGPSDIRYAIILLATIKCGFKLLTPSPRNPDWKNVSLLQSTDCTKFLHAQEMQNSVGKLKAQSKHIKTYPVPDLHDMLCAGITKQYPYSRSFAEAQWDPILVIHSSGSTGPPKPVVTNHASWAVADKDRNMPIVEGRRNQTYALFNFPGDGGRYFSAFPPFHLGGIMSLIVLPIYSTKATVVLGPSDRPPTGQLASAMMQHHRINAIFAPPSIFEQFIQEPEGLGHAESLDFVLYAGGPLAETTGNLLSQKTDVCQFYGSTETNGIPVLVPRREDWAYFEFHPASGADLQPSEDDAFELVLRKKSDRREDRVFSCNFPDIEEYHTGDLFRPHPTKPSLWRFHGRKDDIIVLSNGEKFNPVPSEGIITGHVLVSAALIVGMGRFQPALLIEPKPEVELEVSLLIDEMWSIVEQANAQAPSHGRVTRSMIVIVSPFERAGKGTVIRNMTAEKFAVEIQSLYSADQGAQKHGLPSTMNSENSLVEVKDMISVHVSRCFKVHDLHETDDLYVCGLDSLKTAEILSSIKASSSADLSWLSVQTLYENASIEKLARIVYAKLSTERSAANALDASAQSRTEQMSAMIERYTAGLVPKLTVILIGSTGSLGTYLLSTLLSDPKIGHITCLNRATNAKSKQAQSYESLELSHDLSSVSFITADYTAPHLGIADAKYDELARTTDIIIHNAWPVNFTYALSTFEPHLQGVRNLIDFSLSSAKYPRPHIIFNSSISSVSNYHHTNHTNLFPTATPESLTVPEFLVTDHNAPAPLGYAESKHVAECILGYAATHCQVSVTILRLGQIAGPISDNGTWSKSEWVYAMLKTSQTIGSLPGDLGDVDWVPIDVVARVVGEILHDAGTANGDSGEEGWWGRARARERGARVLNIVNPTLTSWSTLIPPILQRLGTDIKVVPLNQWIKLLEEKQEKPESVPAGSVSKGIDSVAETGSARYDSINGGTETLQSMPALKILGFFRGLQDTSHLLSPMAKEGRKEYSTEEAKKASATLRRLQGVKAEDMGRWMEAWGF